MIIAIHVNVYQIKSYQNYLCYFATMCVYCERDAQNVSVNFESDALIVWVYCECDTLSVSVCVHC